MVKDSETEKNQTLKNRGGKSSASVPGTRAQQKNATREIRATIKKKKKILDELKKKEFRDGIGYKRHKQKEHVL